MRVRSLGWEDALEKDMATDSSILTWRMPWTEEPGGPQSMDSQSDTTKPPPIYSCPLINPLVLILKYKK